MFALVKRRGFGHMDNGVAAALDVIGEWWTPLVVYAVFRGATRFDAIQTELGVARNILTDRLGTLISAGVLEKVPYRERPVRHEYRLTPKGLDLHGTLVMLDAWGNKWVRDGAAPSDGHSNCVPTALPEPVCSYCGNGVSLVPGASND